MTAVEAPADLATRLLQGEPAVIPTDTVVGLAAKPEHAHQLWHLKRRPADKPLILMAASAKPLLDAVEEHCHHDAWSLIDRHWPGALTLVLPAKGPLVELLNPGGKTLGLRIPACDLTLELLDSGPSPPAVPATALSCRIGGGGRCVFSGCTVSTMAVSFRSG